MPEDLSQRTVDSEPLPQEPDANVPPDFLAQIAAAAESMAGVKPLDIGFGTGARTRMPTTFASGEEGEEAPPSDPSPGAGDVSQSAAILTLQTQVETLQVATAALVHQNEQQKEDISRLGNAVAYLPCPDEKWHNLPPEGWTGRPENAPGAIRSRVGDCITAGVCTCETGEALVNLDWQPKYERDAPGYIAQPE